jgi:hypothetical protein
MRRLAVGFNPRNKCGKRSRRGATVDYFNIKSFCGRWVRFQASLRDEMPLVIEVRGLKPTATLGGRSATSFSRLNTHIVALNERRPSDA